MQITKKYLIEQCDCRQCISFFDEKNLNGKGVAEIWNCLKNNNNKLCKKYKNPIAPITVIWMVCLLGRLMKNNINSIAFGCYVAELIFRKYNYDDCLEKKSVKVCQAYINKPCDKTADEARKISKIIYRERGFSIRVQCFYILLLTVYNFHNKSKFHNDGIICLILTAIINLLQNEALKKNKHLNNDDKVTICEEIIKYGINLLEGGKSVK